MATKKILVNLWTDLAKGLKQRTDQACLKRDQYLNLVLRHEAERLEEEVPTRNSEAARAYIAQALSSLPRKPINLMLSEETVQAVNDACERKNLPRDAFIHRVLLFLLLGPRSLDDIIDVDWKWARNRLLEQGPDELYKLLIPSSLLTIGELVEGDPFWYARTCLDYLREEDADTPTMLGAYLSKETFGKTVPNALGFNCYIPDALVDGTPEHQKHSEELNEFLAILGRD